MNLNIYLETKVVEQLDIQAQKLNRKKNSIIREALAEWLSKHTNTKWPQSVTEFYGIKDWDDIETIRSSLLECNKELF